MATCHFRTFPSKIVVVHLVSTWNQLLQVLKAFLYRFQCRMRWITMSESSNCPFWAISKIPRRNNYETRPETIASESGITPAMAHAFRSLLHPGHCHFRCKNTPTRDFVRRLHPPRHFLGRIAWNQSLQVPGRCLHRLICSTMWITVQEHLRCPIWAILEVLRQTNCEMRLGNNCEQLRDHA
jgi:hypothetical protein